MAASAAIGLDELDIVGPQGYADHGYPHEAWERLRSSFLGGVKHLPVRMKLRAAGAS